MKSFRLKPKHFLPLFIFLAPAFAAAAALQERIEAFAKTIRTQTSDPTCAGGMARVPSRYLTPLSPIFYGGQEIHPPHDPPYPFLSWSPQIDGFNFDTGVIHSSWPDKVEIPIGPQWVLEVAPGVVTDLPHSDGLGMEIVIRMPERRHFILFVTDGFKRADWLRATNSYVSKLLEAVSELKATHHEESDLESVLRRLLDLPH